VFVDVAKRAPGAELSPKKTWSENGFEAGFGVYAPSVIEDRSKLELEAGVVKTWAYFAVAVTPEFVVLNAPVVPFAPRLPSTVSARADGIELSPSVAATKAS
jgi:hypothetical protein